MSNPLLTARRVIGQYYDDLARHSIGEMQRAINRKTHLFSIHRKALAIIDKYVPKLFHQTPNAKGFDEKWPKINADLLSTLPNYADYHRANNFIAAILQEGNTQGAWAVKIPPSLVSIKRDRPLRTKKWFAQAKTLAKFHQDWLNAIDNGSYEINRQHPENLYVSLILSAVFYCGLNHKSTLMAFIDAIAKRQKLLSIEEFYYMELVVDDKYLNTNTYDDDGEAVTTQRLFLSWQTCALLKQWYSSAPTNWKHPTTEHELKNLLNSNLKAFGLSVRSLGLFCKAAVTIAENLPNANIPQALIEYTTARNKSYSLPYDDWLGIWGRQTTQLPAMAFRDFKTMPPIKVTIQKVKGSRPSHHHLIDILNKALRTNIKGIKRTAKMAIADINDKMNPFELPTQESLLVNWLLTVLSKRKLSTAARYHSAISGIWLASTVDIDLTSYNGEDYLELYDSALEMARSEKDYQFKAARLQQMHQYGVMFEGLPTLPENLITGTETRPHTRAGFIDEALFAALLNCVGQFTDQSLYQIAQLQVLLIIGYRTGMRLGELIKLRLMDIEPSDIGWLFIRNNKFGNNKSSAALRKIPLFPLLTEQESQLVSAHLQNQRIFNPPNTLLFCEAQSPFTPLDRQHISNMTSQILRQLAPGSQYVFHHLRHSALTRLHMVLHVELFEHNFVNSIAGKMLPYDYAQAINIKRMICGENPRSIYWCLAVFAGHRSPETSFARYFHCSDLLYFEHAKQSQFNVTFNQAHALSGIGVHQLRKLFNKQRTINFTLLQDTLKNKLKPTTTKAKIVAKAVKPVLLTRQKPDIPAICYHILSAIENGENIRLLATKYRIPQTKIEQWLQNALALKQRLNYKGKVRLFATQRYHKLLPGPLRSITEKQLLSKAYQACRELFKEDADNLTWVIEYALDHISSSKSYISFNKLDEFERFTGAAMRICPKSSWTAMVNILDKTQLPRWRQVANGIPCSKGGKLKQKNRNPDGVAHLRLKHPNEDLMMEQVVDSKQYSSNLTKHLFHMLWVMMAKVKPSS